MSESTNPVEQDGKPLQQAFSKKPKFTREQLERYRRYECPECQETHKDEWDAERCCPRDVDEVYVCPECEESHYDMDRATKCEASHGSASNPLAFNRCPECATGYDDVEYAVHCCMWKRMGFAERDQLIRDIRLGQRDPAAFELH